MGRFSGYKGVVPGDFGGVGNMVNARLGGTLSQS